MVWQRIGAIRPDRDWQFLVTPLTHRLLRLRFEGDGEYLLNNLVKGYLRLNVEGEGTSKRWEAFWPEDGASELLIAQTIPIAPNRVEVRSSRSTTSLLANYLLTVDQFVDVRYEV